MPSLRRAAHDAIAMEAWGRPGSLLMLELRCGLMGLSHLNLCRQG